MLKPNQQPLVYQEEKQNNYKFYWLKTVQEDLIKKCGVDPWKVL